MRERSTGPNEIILDKGEISDKIYILTKGNLIFNHIKSNDLT